ncbi:MAG: hypothetical protein NC218_02820 [Acetobacter sp.]|nr:hypothetical protein [Acetobacter sp.]
MEYIGETEIYQEINQALKQIGKSSDEPVNKDILRLKMQYKHQCKQNTHPSLFDRSWVLTEEINAAQTFCDALEAYRLATDVHIDDTPDLSEHSVRILHKGLERYKPYISEENSSIIKALETTIHSRLPEFRSQYILKQYNQQAQMIYRLKKRQKSAKAMSSDCERQALYFFAEILDNEELRKIKPCPEKMNLYINSVKIVDCLPKEKYSRFAKFQLKCRFYYAISRSALILDKPDRTRAQAAYEQYLRFKKAAEKTLEYSNSEYAAAVRRKKQQDEWKYK